MSNLRAAAQQALKTIESWNPSLRTDDDEAAVTAIRAALAQEEQEPGFWGRVAARQSDKIKQLETALAALKQPEQEPVAWQGVYDKTDLFYRKPPQADVRPLYTHPPRREWQGLTDEEREKAIRWAIDLESTSYSRTLARAIEAKLKERNHG
jgi:hypothetical protein